MNEPPGNRKRENSPKDTKQRHQTMRRSPYVLMMMTYGSRLSHVNVVRQPFVKLHTQADIPGPGGETPDVAGIGSRLRRPHIDEVMLSGGLAKKKDKEGTSEDLTAHPLHQRSAAFSKTSCMRRGIPRLGRCDCAINSTIWSDLPNSGHSNSFFDLNSKLVGRQLLGTWQGVKLLNLRKGTSRGSECMIRMDSATHNKTARPSSCELV